MSKLRTDGTGLRLRWEDLLSLPLVAMSFFSVGSLYLESFSGLGTLGVGAVVLLLLIPFVSWPRPKMFWTVFVLVAACSAWMLRHLPARYLASGQDQGTYYLMSHHFSNAGSYFDRNELFNKLPKDLQNRYRKLNWRGKQTAALESCAKDCKGVHDGTYLSGVFLQDARDGTQIFRFIHLHPLWMATFAALGGEFLRPYAPVFFGLLSMLFLSMLVARMTQSRFYAAGFALLLVVYPAHVYFSKFPVSEIVGLGFVSMAFYYLSEALQRHGRSQTKDALIAAVALACFFFVHVSGVFFLPSIVLLLVKGFAEDSKATRRAIYLFSALVLILFGVAVLYALTTSGPYAYRMYRPIIRLQHIAAIVAVVLCLAALLLWLLKRMKLIQLGRDHLKRAIRLLDHQRLRTLFVAATLVSAVAFAVLVYGTDFLAKERWFIRWKIAERGTEAWLGWSYVVLLMHTGWFGIAAFISIARSDSQLFVRWLQLHALILLFYYGTLQMYVPYQFYFLRYMFLYMIPPLLLLGFYYFSKSSHQLIARSLVVISVLIGLGFSGRFAFFEELNGLESIVFEVKDQVHPSKGVLMYDRSKNGYSTDKAKMSFWYGANLDVVNFDSHESFLVFADFFVSQDRPVFILSPQQDLGYPHTQMLLQRSFVRQSVAQSHWIPMSTKTGETQQFNLFRFRP